MATMLCFLATDAAVGLDFLKRALGRAVDLSFNMISIDGDTSPNDMVVIFANGLAGNRMLGLGGEGEIEKGFEKALAEVCLHLARGIVRDGEGVTRVFEIAVEGALSEADARLAARTVASSALVKAAVHGCDPNWGRILAAIGRSGASIEESKIDLYLEDMCLMRGGSPLPFDKGRARAILGRDELRFLARLNLGAGSATALGCDLSEEYVRINSEYTT